MSVSPSPSESAAAQRFAQTSYRLPLDCIHTATALPDASTATCGSKGGYKAPPALSISMSAAVPQPTPGTKRFAQTLYRKPSSWIHTATALPDGSTATCGEGGSAALC